jgi:hypothetical protein
MEAIHSSETAVNKISMRRHIPEDGIIIIHIFLKRGYVTIEDIKANTFSNC